MPQAIRRLTLVQVVYDGATGQPWRAMATDAQDRFVLLTADTPLNAEPGDDLIIRGDFDPPDAPDMPGHVYISADAVAARVTRQLGEDAMIRHYGAPAGTRPFAALVGRDRARAAQARTGDADVTILKPVTETTDPVMGWLMNLARGLNNYGPITMLDSSYNGLGDVGWHASGADGLPILGRLVERLGLSRTRRLWDASLPAVYGAVLNKDKELQDYLSAPGLSQQGVARGPAAAFMAPRLVLPFDRTATTARYLHMLAGLSPTAYAPRRLASLHDMRCLIGAHELAHALEAETMPSRRESKKDQAFQEATADAFAVLAFISANGLTDSTRAIVSDLSDARRVKYLLAGHAIHSTADAVDAALARTEQGLDGLSTADLLGQARQIAAATALDPDRAREFNNWHAMLTGRARERQNKQGGALDALVESEIRAVLAEPPSYLKPDTIADLQQVLSALDRLVYNEAALADPKNRAAAAAVYRTSLSETAADLAGDDDGLRRMLMQERALLLPFAADGFDWVNQRWKARDTAAGDRVAMLDQLAAEAQKAPPQPRADRRPVMLRAPASPWHGSHFGFSLPADQLLPLIGEILRDESTLLQMGAQSAPGQPADLAGDVWRLRMLRQQAAFALRVDPKIWAGLRRTTTPACQDLLTAWAVVMPNPYDPAQRADDLNVLKQARAVFGRQPPQPRPQPQTAQTRRGP